MNKKKAAALGLMLGTHIALSNGESIREFIEPPRGIGNAAINMNSTATAVVQAVDITPRGFSG